MKHWTSEYVFLDHHAPDVVRAAVARISDDLAELGDGEHPRLKTISAQDDDSVHEYEIVVELAPGLTGRTWRNDAKALPTKSDKGASIAQS